MFTFNFNNTTFLVQSYKRGEFCNICEIDGDSFRIDFKNNEVTTSGKETKNWISKAKNLDQAFIENSIGYFIVDKITRKLIEYSITKDTYSVDKAFKVLDNCVCPTMLKRGLITFEDDVLNLLN
jgi:hypothetical protein